MIDAVDFEIVGSYNNQRIANIDAERSINVFQYNDPKGKKPTMLIGTSGLVQQNIVFQNVAGPFRAEFVFNGFHYVVIGSNVYRISSVGISALLGSLNTSTGYVQIDANEYQIIFVDGQNGYIFDTNANSFTQITDASFPTQPIDVCFLDGLFVVPDGGTNGFQLSMLNQGMVWGPAANNFTADDTVGNNWLTIGASTIGGLANSTNNYQTGVPFTVSNSGGSLPSPLVTATTYYAILVDATHIRVATTYANAIAGTAIALTTNGTGTQTITSLGQLQQGFITTHPGTFVGCRTLHRRLFLFSQNFTEVWENAGTGTTLPFRRNNALLMEYGCAAIGSISVSFDIMMFLSQSKDGLGSVMIVSGTEAVPASTRALDFQLSQYAANIQISDCRGFLLKENGLIFYRMNFTAANHTFVYNVSQSHPSFSEESDPQKYWHEEEVLNGNRHPAQTHAFFNGVNYVGDYQNPILYVLDPNTFMNNGESIRRARITKAFVTAGYQRRRVDRMQVDLLQGLIDTANTVTEELDLFTEDGFTLLTEAGDPITLENGLIIFQNQNLSMYLSVSKDGGNTYGHRLKAPMGNVGQRTFRTLWRKLGVTPRGQAFVAKFEYFGATKFAILGAAWVQEVLPE